MCKVAYIRMPVLIWSTCDSEVETDVAASGLIEQCLLIVVPESGLGSKDHVLCGEEC